MMQLGAMMPALPQQPPAAYKRPRKATCRTCGAPQQPGASGRVRLLDGGVIPCPECAPGAALERSRIPSRLRSYTWASYDACPGACTAGRAAAETWAYLSEESPGLYLHGPIGHGKTGLAVCALKTRIRSGGTGLFFSWARDLDRMRPGGEEDMYERLLSADVLVLDDIGAEKPSEWTEDRLFGVIDGRLVNEKQTIITSNLSPQQLRSRINARTADRIASLYECVTVSGANLRRH